MIYASYPRAQYLHYRDEIDAAVARVMAGEIYILGHEVEAFEKAFAAYLGVADCVGVGNGTDALTLAIMALGIGSGDEVIAPSHTAVATVAAIERAGATPVLLDIEADYYTLDPALIAGAVTGRTKAVVAVHLYGQMADMDAIMGAAAEHGLKVIEDCAQSPGATYKGQKAGAIGDIASFSFFPTKNLGAIGDGGAVAVKDLGTGQRLRRLRQYGWDAARTSVEAGLNSRLDEIQAAILNVKLKHLDADNAARWNIAAQYGRLLPGDRLSLPAERPETEHAYHLYVVECGDRDGLKAHLAEYGVAAGIHYPLPVHGHPAYAALATPGGMVRTDAAVGRVLSLPMYPELPTSDIERIADAVRAFFEK